MNNTPYNNGKIKIGVYYAPQIKQYIDADASLVQAALLGEPSDTQTPNSIIANALWAIVVIILVAAVYAAIFFERNA